MPHYRSEGPRQGVGGVFWGILKTICTMYVCVCVCHIGISKFKEYNCRRLYSCSFKNTASCLVKLRYKIELFKNGFEEEYNIRND